MSDVISVPLDGLKGRENSTRIVSKQNDFLHRKLQWSSDEGRRVTGVHLDSGNDIKWVRSTEGKDPHVINRVSIRLFIYSLYFGIVFPDGIE